MFSDIYKMKLIDDFIYEIDGKVRLFEDSLQVELDLYTSKIGYSDLDLIHIDLVVINLPSPF